MPESTAPEPVVRRLDGLFRHNTHLIQFLTLFLARFDPASGELVWANAGHNPPFLLRAGDAQPERLEPTGPAIGLTEESHQGTGSTRLDPGDLLVLYTDGLTEARGPTAEEFGEERLARLLRERSDVLPDVLLGEIRRALDEFSGGALQDDLTILVARRTRIGSRS